MGDASVQYQYLRDLYARERAVLQFVNRRVEFGYHGHVPDNLGVMSYYEIAPAQQGQVIVLQDAWVQWYLHCQLPGAVAFAQVQYGLFSSPRDSNTPTQPRDVPSPNARKQLFREMLLHCSGLANNTVVEIRVDQRLTRFSPVPLPQGHSLWVFRFSTGLPPAILPGVVEVYSSHSYRDLDDVYNTQ